jgi:hypothetical protein
MRQRPLPGCQESLATEVTVLLARRVRLVGDSRPADGAGYVKNHHYRYLLVSPTGKVGIYPRIWPTW